MPIRARSVEDLPAVTALLRQAGLPLEGLETTRGWVMEENGSLLGHIALEDASASTILRSLVVLAGARGKGLGLKLLQHAERQAGPRAIYLRTRTINAWVEKLGYRKLAFDQVPEELRASAEFSGSICASVPIYGKTAHPLTTA